MKIEVELSDYKIPLYQKTSVILEVKKHQLEIMEEINLMKTCINLRLRKDSDKSSNQARMMAKKQKQLEEEGIVEQWE
ncbi:7101_t:CDS:2, partial [Racocetra persica]